MKILISKLQLVGLATLLLACFHASGPLQAQENDLSWIWLSASAQSGEKVDLRTRFTVNGEIKSATLLYTCDNGADGFLNGKPAGKNPDWHHPTRLAVKDLLTPGENELLFLARNKDGIAALVARLDIVYTDDRRQSVMSGADWEASPASRNEWKAAHVMAQYGANPWKEALSNLPTGQATPVDKITTLPGFEVELVYTVPKDERGSWISLTATPGGDLIASDQKGGLWRITPGKTEEDTVVKAMKTTLGGAHGLLWAFDSLYVMVNEQEGSKRGLWRLWDRDGDGVFEEEKHLRQISGSGEHGPHAVVLSPDGKSLFIVCGNFTNLPDPLEKSRAPRNWGEDHVVTRLWDARGHAKGRLAPGGFILKTDPEAKELELYSYGYRNQYDVAFNSLGDLFTYDSDMEWDIGAPWYRPTRINLATSGSDMGWRSGAGVWPTYYPDSLPGVADIGPGSPTGLVSGQGAKFPSKYQHAIYANDWTYGTMYALIPTAKGGGYEVQVEEFISGKPLPLSDSVISPQDGAMYFTVGGRNTQSALYRVIYTGDASVAPSEPEEATDGIRLRHELETLHEIAPAPSVLDKAWPHLGHEDRWIRWAARVAVERQPVDSWAERALAESSDWSSIEALVALARQGAPSWQEPLLARANSIDFSSLSIAQQLALIRVYQLSITRQGSPEDRIKESTLARLEALFPASDNALNIELSQTLSALGSPQVVAKTVPLMATARDEEVNFHGSRDLLGRNDGYAGAFRAASGSQPNRQQIALAYAIRETSVGWTPELRRTYFSWFPHTAPWTGGNSFRGFIENIRQDALAHVVTDENERQALDELSKKSETNTRDLADITLPKGPGRHYSVDEVAALIPNKDSLRGRDFKRGRSMFIATSCLACHPFNGEGGSIGPDISGSVNRYSVRDLMENIIEPSKVISDQYDTHQITKKDGSVLIGRIVGEQDNHLQVAMNPFAPHDIVAVGKADIATSLPYPVSMMPPGLINALNEEELKDLVAYILAAGNPADEVFHKP